jgi:hypothetical protein
VVENVTHNPKIEGSNPGESCCHRQREKMAKKFVSKVFTSKIGHESKDE